MSNLLWKAYLEHDVDRCRNLLGNGAQPTSKGQGATFGHGGSLGTIASSPGAAHGASPRNVKSKKSLSHMGSAGLRNPTSGLTKTEINSRDSQGLTILHRAVSSHTADSLDIALAFIEHPLIDLSVQDKENGWTALHRALYFGNISIARAILRKDSTDTYFQGPGNTTTKGTPLVRIKDYEGNSAFDVYNSTIARRTLHPTEVSVEANYSDDSDSDYAVVPDDEPQRYSSIDGDEFYAFGSNKNLTLGFGDEDDRQHPEKITLQRPDHLIWRFYREFLNGHEEEDHPKKGLEPKRIEDLPTVIRNRPIIIQDATLSKLHSAILTTDPVSNLYVCGFGPGGRLGLGHDITSFNYVCVEGGALEEKKVSAIALGQNHSLAVTSDGGVVSWGTNTWGTLGYTLPRPANDEEPINNSPRQIFGPLKKEFVIGVAASSIHSVAHTSNSLYTWGKNEGQLGLMDSDSRSLEAQPIPRKVAASLFTSTIQMVSAINRATICLLANHTVCVFTNYGYNIVKFPLYGGFSNYHFKSRALTTRYEEEPSHISLVTGGGDTIAAVSSRGDLFTMTVSHNLDSSTTSASSTTNPAKIRSSLSQPQKIWSLRKGNWDGIKSVGVGENGSVILCTQAGAVWRRVKRTKVKEAFSAHAKNKDYKFQRVPGLTNVAAVRSNTFGGYAAIRKDCDVMTQISIDGETLWDDIAPLFCVSGQELTFTSAEASIKRVRDPWPREVSIEHLDPLRQAVLLSANFEVDVAHHLSKGGIGHENYDAKISSSVAKTKIPIHSFMFAARSPLIRDALGRAKEMGEFIIPDVLTIRATDESIDVEFQGLDFITIFNLGLYLYTDKVIDVWHFSRNVPSRGNRYRQIRSELMRVAGKLEMYRLEHGVRSMAEPERRMNADFASALKDPAFLIDGDAVIELDGDEVTIHSSFWRQRCPFFEGLFGGRAGGQWLAGRKEDSEPVRVDLSHIEPSTFNVVLRHVYTDAGTELFDDIVLQDVDELCDFVMDVMSVANELMLDRLSQVCQQTLGRFVNTRNICNLLNDVAPCAVREFKEAGLEYICLQLETMLDNHLLNDLDGDLLAELDEVVRENQLACLPFVKSGRAELLLHERHPSLVGELDEDRQRKLRDMAFRISLREEEGRLSSSFKSRLGGFDGTASPPPTSMTPKRHNTPQHAATSPCIRPKHSTADLMFDMEDDESSPPEASSPSLQPLGPTSTPLGSSNTALPPPAFKNKGKRLTFGRDSSLPNAFQESTTPPVGSPGTNPKTWVSPGLPPTKLNMREIMSQASSNQTSSLSLGISAQREKDEAASRAAAPKLSQKERKKQQQQAALQQEQLSKKPSHSDSPSGPWQVAASGPRVNLDEIIGGDSNTPPAGASSLKVPTPSPGRRPRAASPDTRFSGQRGKSDMSPQSYKSQRSRGPVTPQLMKSSPLATNQELFPALGQRAEPTLQLSMSDIIGQQKREQDLVKEAVAKRSLQEIQEEQAFQEWWDKESRKAQEEETARSEPSQSTPKKGSTRGRGKRGRGGGGGRGTSTVVQGESRTGKDLGAAAQGKDRSNK
ncbi:hypothetical protein V493_05929 [Pseudogymnoascus sp. VKM F-4281 (FW-2241)]|nr:hypothetical protein V493_05929 [Pseudogymnoascus sp. VKM F-4281 (FW-2241)]